MEVHGGCRGEVVSVVDGIIRYAGFGPCEGRLWEESGLIQAYEQSLVCQKESLSIFENTNIWILRVGRGNRSRINPYCQGQEHMNKVNLISGEFDGF